MPWATNPVNVGANASATSALTLTASSTASLGSFPVTVNAISGSLSRSTPFTLTVTSGNQPPTANFSSVTNGLTATFTDSSTDSDGTIASRSWNFGDGSTSTVANPSKRLHLGRHLYGHADRHRQRRCDQHQDRLGHSVQHPGQRPAGGELQQQRQRPGRRRSPTAPPTPTAPSRHVAGTSATAAPRR